MLCSEYKPTVFFEGQDFEIINNELVQYISNLSTNYLNNFCHHIQEKYLYFLNLVNDLPEYLEHDALELYYQPQIDLKSGKTVSVEALVRWNHKNAGAISPDIFIPLAEQNGYIDVLTIWVIENALNKLNTWLNNDIEINIAVNISMLNLHDEYFPELVTGLLDKWSVPPSLLKLEITEGFIMHNPEHAIKNMSRLCDIGINLSLDDFGSGYSSLGYLAKLPISELKIDRNLVIGMDNNKRNAKIIKSTIELAKNLGFLIIAEGVENMKIYNELVLMGCDLAQGYNFCKPVNHEIIDSWLSDSVWGIKDKHCDLFLN